MLSGELAAVVGLQCANKWILIHSPFPRGRAAVPSLQGHDGRPQLREVRGPDDGPLRQGRVGIAGAGRPAAA